MKKKTVFISNASVNKISKTAPIFDLSRLGLDWLSNKILTNSTGKIFYKSLTDTREGYVSSFTGVPLP